MPSTSFADLISCLPGDYLIRRKAYDRVEDFQDELNWTQRFCLAHGFAFEAVDEDRYGRPEAFLVHIGGPTPSGLVQWSCRPSPLSADRDGPLGIN